MLFSETTVPFFFVFVFFNYRKILLFRNHKKNMQIPHKEPCLMVELNSGPSCNEASNRATMLPFYSSITRNYFLLRSVLKGCINSNKPRRFSHIRYIILNILMIDMNKIQKRKNIKVRSHRI